MFGLPARCYDSDVAAVLSTADGIRHITEAEYEHYLRFEPEQFVSKFEAPESLEGILRIRQSSLLLDHGSIVNLYLRKVLLQSTWKMLIQGQKFWVDAAWKGSTVLGRGILSYVSEFLHLLYPALFSMKSFDYWSFAKQKQLQSRKLGMNGLLVNCLGHDMTSQCYPSLFRSQLKLKNFNIQEVALPRSIRT